MTFQLKIIILIILASGFAWLTGASFRSFRSHGFYRYFAWVAIVALILLNIEDWFYEPFSIHQLISWLLLIASTYLAIHGMLLLRKLEKADGRRIDPSLMDFEKTTELVIEGAYRYIRHPLYGALIYLAWGTFFKDPSWAGISLTLIATIFLTITSRVEEDENVRYFGDEYLEYMKKTKMFIPFIF